MDDHDRKQGRFQTNTLPNRPWTLLTDMTNLHLGRFFDLAVMLQPDFDPAPTQVRIHRCKFVSQCKARRCRERATLMAEKIDGAGRHVRQIELCARHCEIVIEWERKRGLEISDRRSE